MITDEMLTRACADYSNAFVKSLLEQEMPDHEFSARFRRRMKRLIWKVDHPVRYRVSQIAAAVALAVMLGFATTMAVSPAARAAVVNWVQGKVQDWFSYSYVGESPATAQALEAAHGSAKYYISALPDGYRKRSETLSEDRYKGVFADESDNIIIFTYSLSARMKDIFLEDDGGIIETEVNGVPAKLYLHNTPGMSNIILWYDENTNTMFSIVAPLSQEKLVALAESVKEK